MDMERLRGLGVALATPFEAGGRDASGAVDFPAFRALVSRVIAGNPAVGPGADFLVVLGSTGEAATVTDDERDLILKAALEEAQGVPVFLGTGHNSTAKAVELSVRAARLGADGLLVVTPYYNKPQPAGLEAHFRAVAAAAPGTPIIVYNVPGRTGPQPPAQGPRAALAHPRPSRRQGILGKPRPDRRDPEDHPRGQAPLLGRRSPGPAHYRDGRRRNHLGGRKHPPLRDQGTRGRLPRGQARRGAQASRSTAAAHRRPLPREQSRPLKAALAFAGWCSDAVRLPLASASESTRARLAELLPAFGIGAKSRA